MITKEVIRQGVCDNIRVPKVRVVSDEDGKVSILKE